MSSSNTPINQMSASSFRLLVAVGSVAAAALTAGVVVTAAGGDSATGAPIPSTEVVDVAPPVATPPSATGDSTETVDRDAAAARVVTTPDTAPDTTAETAPETVPETAPDAAVGSDGSDGDVEPDDEIDEVDLDEPAGVIEPVDHHFDDDDHGDGGDADTPTPFEPADADPPGPCDGVDDAQQFAIPSVIALDSGVMHGVLSITNCGGQAVHVELDASNSVELDADQLQVDVDGAQVGFTIDEHSLDVGAIEVKIKVTQTGCCADYATVHAFKQGFDPDYAIDLPLSAGEGQGGCKAGCISSAWASGNHLNTSVHLTVETKVPARIKAFVSKQAPVQDQAGNPAMPGLSPAADSGPDATALDATLTGLDPSTKYFIVIRATDDNGSSYVSETFTTVTPVENPDSFGGNDPKPGCSVGCITSAGIEATAHDRAELTVGTMMPATLDVFVGTNAIDDSGDHPVVPQASIHHQSDGAVTEWSRTLTGLTPATTYSIVLQATDENGRQDFQTATFSTPQAPPVPVEISIDRIDIHGDGDRAKWNKGEVRFGWTYANQMLGRRSEQKLSDGATIWLDAYNELAVSLGPDDRTDLVMVYAGERDGLGFGFCEAPHPGLDCAGLKWNLAASTGKTLAEIEALPPCEYYGFEGGSADDHCDHIESYDEGHDWVHFSAIVRYDID